MSETFYVPSVPRALLIPGLDTYEVPLTDEDEDPTPPGSHWLFRPPPYVSRADLKSETITLCNPAVWGSANLSGYNLSDRARHHMYSFPQGYSLPAGKSVTLHCCPGKLSPAEVDALPKRDLLWKNQDGSLRRKEVLNDDGDSVKLLNARGREVASLTIPGEDDEEDEPQELNLPGVKRAQMLALRNLVLTLCYLRLVCLAVAASRVTINPDLFLLFTGLAHGLDLLGRWASSQPGVPMDDVGVVLATMGDRLAALLLLGGLVVLDNDSRHVQLFAGMLALDIMTNWLQLSVASAAGGSHPLAGGAFVRGRGAAPDFASHLMLRHPLALTVVSVGNEAFLLWSYLVASASLSYRLKPVLLTVECALEKGISALFFSSGNFWQSSRCQIHSDVSAAAGEEGFVDEDRLPMMETIIIHKGDSLHNAVVPGGGGGAVVWKTVWMILMICCACRQLLGCIQALISMSTLSSGVIADAAGQDMHRRGANQHGSSSNGHARGRSAVRASGGGSARSAGARSRSRVR